MRQHPLSWVSACIPSVPQSSNYDHQHGHDCTCATMWGKSSRPPVWKGSAISLSRSAKRPPDRHRTGEHQALLSKSAVHQLRVTEVLPPRSRGPQGHYPTRPPDYASAGGRQPGKYTTAPVSCLGRYTGDRFGGRNVGAHSSTVSPARSRIPDHHHCPRSSACSARSGA